MQQGAASGLLALFDSYGYLALAGLVLLAAAGVPLPFPVSGAFVALGALTAEAHGPSFLALIVVAVLAAAAGHSVDFWVGRAGGGPLLRRWQARLARRMGAETLARAERGLARGSSLLILLTRFLLTPLASPVSLLAGAARVPYRRYLALELVGQAIYFTGYLTLGRILGVAITRNPLTFVALFALIALLVVAPTLLLRLRPDLLRRLTGGRDARHSPAEDYVRLS